MKDFILRKVSPLLVLVLMGVLSLGLIACGGKSNEEIIREGVTAEFESIKNLDGASLDQMLEAFAEAAELEQFGVDSKEFCRAWLEGFDYSIDDVIVDGDSATVTTTITIRSLEEALSDWETQITALFAAESSSDLSEDELFAKVGSMLMESIADAPLTTETVDLPYVLEDSTWTPDEVPFNAALSRAFVGGLA